MTTYIALLRGINVGKAKRVPMADLRDLLAGLGYADVATLLNSGNAVFRASTGEAAAHAAQIAAAVAERTDFDVPVIVKSASDLTAIVAENPLARGDFDPSRVLVAFVQDQSALSALAAIAPLATPPEEFVVGQYAAYVHSPGGVLASAAGKAMLGKAGRAATTRNWSTVLKLHALTTA